MDQPSDQLWPREADGHMFDMPNLNALEITEGAFGAAIMNVARADVAMSPQPRGS